MIQLKRNLTEHAYLLVRDRILRGELPFGAGLSRRVLAGEMGISIVPVGDALQRLESEGLVESRPRVGTRVRIPTAQAIRGHYVVREALESQAARMFAATAAPEQRAEILGLAAQLDALFADLPEAEAERRERAFEVHRTHMRFHMRVAECTGCDELCRAVERNQVLVFNWLYDAALGGPPPTGWHTTLARVLEQRDPEAADAATRRHTRYRMDEVLARMEPYCRLNEERSAAFPKSQRRRGSVARGRRQPVGPA